MSNWRYANQVPTKEWRSAMTLPRELTLATTRDGIRVIQKPVKEVNSIKLENFILQEMTIESGKALSFPLNNKLIEINIELEKESSNEFGLVIRHSETENTKVSIDVLNDLLLVDRTQSGEYNFSSSFPSVQEAPIVLKNNRVKLQLFIDTSSIEVFANDGEIAVTSLIFPSELSKELVLFSNDGITNVVDLKITELDTIWK